MDFGRKQPTFLGILQFIHSYRKQFENIIHSNILNYDFYEYLHMCEIVIIEALLFSVLNKQIGKIARHY